MIKNLTVINLKAHSPVHPTDGRVFVLNTCQRTLILGIGEAPFLYLKDNALRKDLITGVLEGREAYIFLLETMCGLHSEVLAEGEITGQFKEAYRGFLNILGRNTFVMGILEKAFQDNKKIRTNYLMELGQLSYAGIARKLIHTAVKDGDVLVLGSGSLAESLIKLLKKRHEVYVSARNETRVDKLRADYGLKVLPWGRHEDYVKLPFIVNTIGANETLFGEEFFSTFFAERVSSSSAKKLFIDLGSPSVIDTHLTTEDGVLRLEDIFKKSAKLGQEKMERIAQAKEAISDLATKRAQTTLASAAIHTEEELTFAYSL